MGSLNPEAVDELRQLLELPGADAVWEAFFLEEMETRETDAHAGQADWDKIWQQIEAARGRERMPAPPEEADRERNPDTETGTGTLLPHSRNGRSYRTLQIAAAVLVAILCGTWLISKFTHKEMSYQPARTAIARAIMPGKNGAVLHLMNGETIHLDDAGDGVIASQQGVQVVKNGSTLRYVGNTNTTRTAFNQITTDRGRQWNFTLPDGSKVWLNAASSIRFPLTFTGQQRLVEIQGEAYFEVKHDAARPFMVKVNGQVIEDIGTSFNVNAYPDEGAIRTTLISGSIRLGYGQRSVIMKPGQQAVVRDAISLKALADPLSVIAWKNGMFQFSDADLPVIMRQLSRWYNVEVAYKNGRGVHQFTGKIPRDMPITDVLKILEQAGAHFKVEYLSGKASDGRITVLP